MNKRENNKTQEEEEEEERCLSLLKDAIIDELLFGTPTTTNNDTLNKVQDSKSLKEIETIFGWKSSKKTLKEAAIAVKDIDDDDPLEKGYFIYYYLFPFSTKIDAIPSDAHNYFCERHISPWCDDYNLPRYYCSCEECIEHNTKFKCATNAQCPDCCWPHNYIFP